MVSRRELIGGLALLSCAPTKLNAKTILGPGLGEPAPNDWNALVIGIDDYDHARPLNAAVNDAMAVSDRLQDAGYKVDTLQNPTLVELEQGIQRASSGIRPESNFLFYFAGHGFQVGGTNFLMARDSLSGQGQGMIDSSINFLKQLNGFAAKQPRQCLVLLDACRNDPFGVELPDISTNMASVMAPGGFSILYSAGSGQFALDGLNPADPDDNGVFVRALLEHMQPGVSLQNLIYNTRKSVIEVAASVGHDQHPAIYDQSRGDYSLGVAKSDSPRDNSNDWRRGQFAQPSDPKTASLIIGQEIDGVNLPNIANDFGLMSDLFANEWAKSELSFGESSQEIIDRACRLGSSNATTIMLYYAGGCGVNEDGEYLMISRPSGKFEKLEIKLLLSKLAREGRRLICFFDTVFMSNDWWRYDSEGRYDAEASRPSLWETMPQMSFDGPTEELERTKLAIFSAAGFDEMANDGVAGERHSPFTIALANTVGRSDLSVRQMADTIQLNVMDSTRSTYLQRPELWVNHDPNDEVLWARRKPSEPVSDFSAGSACPLTEVDTDESVTKEGEKEKDQAATDGFR